MRIGIFVLMAILAGCANPVEDMLQGRYSETEAVPPDTGAVGTWTGSMSSYLLTLRIHEDGTGFYCYSWNEKDAIGRLKYDGNGLIFQSSTTASIVEIRPDAMIIQADYALSRESILRPDGDLAMASPYCVKAIPAASRGGDASGG